MQICSPTLVSGPHLRVILWGCGRAHSSVLLRSTSLISHATRAQEGGTAPSGFSPRLAACGPKPFTPIWLGLPPWGGETRAVAFQDGLV